MWDSTNGVRSISQILVNDFDLDLTGWDLWGAAGVSDDGRVIVGVGLNPQGKVEAWLAVLGDAPTPPVPTLSPAGLLVFAAGLLGFIGYYRRRF